MHERLDHLSVELEFMHFLTYKESSRCHDGIDKTEIVVDAQRSSSRTTSADGYRCSVVRWQKADTGIVRSLPTVCRNGWILRSPSLGDRAAILRGGLQTSYLQCSGRSNLRVRGAGQGE